MTYPPARNQVKFRTWGIENSSILDSGSFHAERRGVEERGGDRKENERIGEEMKEKRKELRISLHFRRSISYKMKCHNDCNT